MLLECSAGLIDTSEESRRLLHEMSDLNWCRTQSDPATELIRLGHKKNCYVCLEDFALNLVSCGECGGSLCPGCLRALVRKFAEPECAGQRLESRGELACASCKRGTFSLSFLRGRLDDEVFDLHLRARDKALESIATSPYSSKHCVFILLAAQTFNSRYSEQ